MTDPGNYSDMPAPHSGHDFEVNQPETRKLLRYSVNQITTCRSSFDADIQSWLHVGLTEIGLWRRKIDEFGKQESVDLIRESGLGVSTLSFVGGFTGSMGMQYRESLDDAYDALFTAAAVGARTVIVAPGSRGRYTTRHERRLIVHVLREVSCAAKSLGLRLAVLPMNEQYAGSWTSLYSLQQTADLLAEVGHDGLDMVYDVFQLGRREIDSGALAELAPLIGVVQLSDGPEVPASQYDRCLPGDGMLPIRESLVALFEGGFEGDIDVQIWSDTLWQREPTSLLAACRERVDGILADYPAEIRPSVTA